MSQNVTLLILVQTAEVLKVYEPLIQGMKEQYHVFIHCELSKHRGENDRYNEILNRLKIPYKMIPSFELVDNQKWQDSYRVRLTLAFLWPVLLEFRANRIAKNILKTSQPNIIMVTSESRVLMRHVLFEGKKRGIPSIFFTGTLLVGPKEFEEEIKKRTIRKSRCNLRTTIFNFLLRLLRVPNAILVRLVGLYRVTRGNFGIPGGGGADIFAVASQRVQSYFKSAGVNPKKMYVMSNPLIQSLYQKGKNGLSDNVVKPVEFDGIPHENPVLLWAHNDSLVLYKVYYSQEEMKIFREEKLRSLCEADKRLFVLMKMHPKGDLLSDFVYLMDQFPRVRVFQDGDFNDYLPFCDIVLVRSSLSGGYGLAYGVPVISFDDPPLPGGTYYRDLGGTIHVKDNRELQSTVQDILKKDPVLMQHIAKKRLIFLEDNFDIQIDKDPYSKSLIPAFEKHKNLIEHLLQKG